MHTMKQNWSSVIRIRPCWHRRRRLTAPSPLPDSLIGNTSPVGSHSPGNAVVAVAPGATAHPRTHSRRRRRSARGVHALVPLVPVIDTGASQGRSRNLAEWVLVQVRTDHRTAVYGTPHRTRGAEVAGHNCMAELIRRRRTCPAGRPHNRLLERKRLLGVRQCPAQAVVFGIGLRGLRHLRRQSGLLVCTGTGLVGPSCRAPRVYSKSKVISREEAVLLTQPWAGRVRQSVMAPARACTTQRPSQPSYGDHVAQGWRRRRQRVVGALA